jgi:hypothetical protein
VRRRVWLLLTRHENFEESGMRVLLLVERKLVEEVMSVYNTHCCVRLLRRFCSYSINEMMRLLLLGSLIILGPTMSLFHHEEHRLLSVLPTSHLPPFPS